MIQNLKITNFKCHEHTELELKNISILSGMNGMGKSSVIQALLLLRQSYFTHGEYRSLELNGDLCEVGNIGDAIYQFSSSDSLKFVLSFDGLDYEWIAASAQWRLSQTTVSFNNNPTWNSHLPLFSREFQYLGALRNGPQKLHVGNTRVVEQLNQISYKYGQCEFVAHFLYFNSEEQVLDCLAINDALNTLKSQVNEWLKEISPEINLHLELLAEYYTLNYSYNRGGGLPPTSRFNPLNVGFGVSYALPILVAILSARPGSLIIIDTPEAHLHPSALSKLMRLIAKAANAGVQFIIETHSDHIINGLRVALKEGVITPDKTSVYHLDIDQRLRSSRAELIEIDAKGRIYDAPAGFFDQTGDDLRKIIGR